MEQLLPGVEVCPVQLPGRETRLAEPPCSEMPALVQALAPALRPHLDRPFALLGHSLGALVAFELARELRRQQAPPPVHLFVLGHSAPHIAAGCAPVHRLPDDEFVAEVRRMGGTPDEVLAHAELRALMLPILRADFALSEGYRYADAPPLACPITALGGLADEHVSRERLQGWQMQTSATFSLHMLPGGHFFLHSARPLVLELVARQLAPHLAVA